MRSHVLVFFGLKCERDQLVVYVIKILESCECKDTFCLCTEYKQRFFDELLRTWKMHNAIKVIQGVAFPELK